MTFFQTVVENIHTNWSPTNVPIVFGFPLNQPKSYVAANTVNNPQQGDVLCDPPGSAGTILIQFNGVAESQQRTYDILESLRAYVQALNGTLGDYSIQQNLVGGILQFSSGLSNWASLIEAQIQWYTTANSVAS